MTIARKNIIEAGTEGVYHCTTRCVRRAFLCGFDPYLNRNFEHRRQWIKERLIFLSSVFGLDIVGYSIMSNHLHVILRTRPEETLGWSREEIARRWLILHPPRTRLKGTYSEPSEEEMRKLETDPVRLARLQLRLSDISWFMRELDEPIARWANREDGCTGRFWEGRYKSRRLLDEAALLACMVYVELNPVRAGMAKSPGESEFTSGGDRLKSRQSKERLDQEGWDRERGQDPSLKLTEDRQKLATGDNWLCPIQSESCRKGIFFSLTRDEYLEILETTGRLVCPEPCSKLPLQVVPALERLSVNPIFWVDTVCRYEGLFRRIVGCLDKVLAMARASGRHWFQGTRACRERFCRVS